MPNSPILKSPEFPQAFCRKISRENAKNSPWAINKVEKIYCRCEKCLRTFEYSLTCVNFTWAHTQPTCARAHTKKEARDHELLVFFVSSRLSSQLYFFKTDFFSCFVTVYLSVSTDG